jgi:hypothetical protein
LKRKEREERRGKKGELMRLLLVLNTANDAVLEEHFSIKGNSFHLLLTVVESDKCH